MTPDEKNKMNEILNSTSKLHPFEQIFRHPTQVHNTEFTIIENFMNLTEVLRKVEKIKKVCREKEIDFIVALDVLLSDVELRIYKRKKSIVEEYEHRKMTEEYGRKDSEKANHYAAPFSDN